MDHLEVTKVDDVFYLDQFDGKSYVRGTLYLTLTHLFFIGSSRKQEIWLSTQSISSVKRPPLTVNGAPVVIFGKDFRCIRLVIPKESACNGVYNTVKRLSHTDKIMDLPCFSKGSSEFYWEKSLGWSLWDLRTQFARFGIPNSTWTLTDANSYFQICDTYPTVLCVPTSVSLSLIQASAKFRSRGRLPVLTYLHPNGKSALCRSSQPLAGFSSRSSGDQLLLEAVLYANLGSPLLYVVDTRPAINALTNRAQGKGYEDANAYRNISIQFFDIENIHAVRGAFAKLLDCCQNSSLSPEQYFSGINKSDWLKYLRTILEASYFVAHRLHDGCSVLVHCSDGWDRTAQVCCLAQIILDPYYRTFDGFQALLFKDWLSFGHKFSDRCSLVSSSDPRDVSPIFTQFLDCVRHLIKLFPSKFEFSSELLILLHDSVYSATFGNFIGCSERERLNLDVTRRTYSFWAYAERYRAELLNPYYEYAAHLIEPCCSPDASLNSFLPEVYPTPTAIDLTSTGTGSNRHAVDLLPSFALAPQLFDIWRGLYLRFEWRLLQSCDYSKRCMTELTSAKNILSSHHRLLEARIRQLCGLLGRSPSDVLKCSSGINTVSNGQPLTKYAGDEYLKSVDHSCNLPSDRPKWPLSYCRSTIQEDIASNNSESTPVVNFDFGSSALPVPTFKQLSLELNSIDASTRPHQSQQSSCSSCENLLNLCVYKFYCVSCGTFVCPRCVQPRPVSLHGVFPSESIRICSLCSKQRALPQRPASRSAQLPSVETSSHEGDNFTQNRQVLLHIQE